MITAATQIIAAFKNKRRNRKAKGKKKKIKIGKISLSKRGSTPRFNDFLHLLTLGIYLFATMIYLFTWGKIMSIFEA